MAMAVAIARTTFCLHVVLVRIFRETDTALDWNLGQAGARQTGLSGLPRTAS